MFGALKGIISKKSVLYYPGCITERFYPEIREKYEKLLEKAGIEFVEIELMKCCGSPALNAGYKKDFEKLKERNLEVLKNRNVGKIITNCPACYRVFKEEYNFPVEHISQVLLESSSELKASIKGKVAYFDSCNLSKHGVTEEPRELLKELGMEVAEFGRNREKSMCCGAGGELKANFPKLADDIASRRLKESPAKTIITCCLMCRNHLRENAKEKGIEVLELSEVIE
jgi:Fe-S oxidoreductase